MLRLIHRHRLAHAAVRKLLIDEHDADDAVQTTLMAVARSIGTFERRSRFTTWLYRIAEREALQVLRRNQRAARPADGMEELTEEVARMSSMIVDRAMVAEIVADLDEKFRAPLLMCDVEGLEYAEIAERLDVPLNTVRTRIRRARPRWLPRSSPPRDSARRRISATTTELIGFALIGGARRRVRCGSSRRDR